MSGTVRVRKQWQIQEGPRGTLRKLRNQLAEDGCVESQVVIAKHLLEEAQDSGSWTERTTQAVHWLMKASEQGNEEATVLLKNCFYSGAGITEDNYEEVKVCLGMSEDEKAFRSAARDVFNHLTPFGQEFITTGQLRAKLCVTEEPHAAAVSEKEENAEEDIKKDEVDSSFTKWYQESSIFDGEHLTEDKLAEVGGQISQGKLPSVSLGHGPVISHQQKSRRLAKRGFKRFKEVVSKFSTKSLEFIAQHGDGFLLSLIPWGKFRVLTFILICSFLTLETIAYLLPLMAFYLSLIIMVLSSVQLISDRKSLHIFVTWLQVFQLADANLPTQTAERKFCCRRLYPYSRFFVSAVLIVCTYPVCDVHALPHSEITALCGGFAAFCLFGLNAFSPLVLAFASLSCLLTALRVACFMDLCGPSYFLGLLFNGWTIEVMDRIFIHLSLANLPVVLFLALCLWMASTDSWHGSYKFLLPNLVACTWMQLLVVFVPHSTWTGICQGALFLISAVVLPAVLIVVVLSLLVYTLVGLIDFSMQLFATGCVLALTVLSKWFVDKREKLRQGPWRKWLTCLQVACAICAALQFIPAFQNLSFSFSECDDVSDFIDWQAYHQSCHQPAWNEFTTARVQDYCSHLHGAPVAWQGQVNRIKIRSIRNRLEDTLAVLPSFVSAQLRCIFGSPYEACNDDDMSAYHFQLCSTRSKMVKHKCHVKQWDLYDFEIAVQMSGGYWNSAEVVLVADNPFKDFMFHLDAGDKINFTGLLHSSVGGLHPAILLKSVACEDCAFNMEPVVAHRYVHLYDRLHVVYNFVFNYFFHPFLKLKHPQDATYDLKQ